MKFYIFLLFFSVFLSGCGGIVPTAPLASSTPTLPVIPPTANPVGNSSSPQTRFGVIRCNSAQQDSFHKNLKRYLSSVKHPDSVAPVDCTVQSKNKRGFFIMEGKVYFANNQFFNPNSTSQQLQISTGNLMVVIQDVTGSQLRLDYTIDLYTSTVHGQNINLTFNENQGIGSITLLGQSKNGKFDGLFSFNNRLTYDRSTAGAQGPLAWFSFETCAILNCQ